jgi:hypothetical protein
MYTFSYINRSLTYIKPIKYGGGLSHLSKKCESWRISENFPFFSIFSLLREKSEFAHVMSKFKSFKKDEPHPITLFIR